MGGANGGEIASETAVKSIEEQILASYEEDFKSEEMKLMLSTLIFHANSAVYDMAQENESLKGMGTTIVVAIVLDNVAHIAHAGDSRAYLLHNGNIMQITTDHSMVQELIKNGDLTVEQAKVHPQKNIITRALGVNPVVEIDYEKVPLAKDDRILICTDGLTNYIEPEKIRNLADEDVYKRQSGIHIFCSSFFLVIFIIECNQWILTECFNILHHFRRRLITLSRRLLHCL